MQRQLALQRLQEQEREMQMRFEQQRQMTQIRQMQNYGYPQVCIFEKPQYMYTDTHSILYQTINNIRLLYHKYNTMA